MHEAARQAISSLAHDSGFLYLACEISKRQPIQFAVEECHDMSGLTLLDSDANL